MANMMKKSLNVDGVHVSPLGQGRIDEQYDQLEVAVLQWPDKALFDKLVYKGVMASRGGRIADDEVDVQVVEDAFTGGLNQSLEWVNVTFEVSGVSRGVTHELVRTRQASYAQQTFRHTDLGNPNVRMPEGIVNADPEIQMLWVETVDRARAAYMEMVEADIEFQDARTVLPIATETYIVCNFPLKVFMDTFAYRGCYMMYPEIVVLFHRMRDALLEKCPWLAPFVLITCERTSPVERVERTESGFIEPVLYEHSCTFQGWEVVEGHCPFSWAKESNRTWKSRVFKS